MKFRCEERNRTSVEWRRRRCVLFFLEIVLEYFSDTFRRAAHRVSDCASAHAQFTIHNPPRGAETDMFATTLVPTLLSSRSTPHDLLRAPRRSAVTHASLLRPRPINAGLFDFLQNNKDVGGRDPMFEKQQEILKKRRQNVNLEKEINERRRRVGGYMKKNLPEAEMRKINAENERKAKALSKEAMKGGIPLPMASFGMPEFDGGERFDLKGPYADEGWVDETDDGLGFFSRLFGKKQPPPPPPPPPAKKRGFFSRK